MNVGIVRDGPHLPRARRGGRQSRRLRRVEDRPRRDPRRDDGLRGVRRRRDAAEASDGAGRRSVHGEAPARGVPRALPDGRRGRHPGHGGRRADVVHLRDGGTRGQRRRDRPLPRAGARGGDDPVRDHAVGVAGAHAPRRPARPARRRPRDLPQVGARRRRDRQRHRLRAASSSFSKGSDRRRPAGGAARRPRRPSTTAGRRLPLPAGAGLWPDEPEPRTTASACAGFIASPNVAEKSWIWTQYDHMVGTNTVERPGGDAAVVRVKGTTKALALKSDVNPFFCAARPVARRGARRRRGGPLGRLHRRPPARRHGLPELRQPGEAGGHGPVRGRGARDCGRLPGARGPGRVRQRLLLQRDRRPRDPSHPDGRDGRAARGRREAASGSPFRREGDLVALLGETRDELGGSRVPADRPGARRGAVPGGGPGGESAPHRAPPRAWRGGRRLASAHDLADGGLAVALAECAMQGGLGAEIAPRGPVRRSVASVRGDDRARGHLVCPVRGGRGRRGRREARRPFRKIGQVGGRRLRILRLPEDRSIDRRERRGDERRAAVRRLRPRDRNPRRKSLSIPDSHPLQKQP